MRTLLLIVSVLLIVSCKNNQTQIPTSTVVKGDYVDDVIVPGVLESTNNYNITCPGLNVDATVHFLIPDGTFVKKGDVVCLLESRELANRYEEALRNLQTSEIEYNKSEADLEMQLRMLQAQVLTIEATTSINRLDSLQLKFSSPVRKQIIQLELKQAEIEKEKILKQLEFLKRINHSELQKMQLRIDQQRKRVERAKANLDKLKLTSNSDGIAMRAKWPWRDVKVNEGDIVWGVLPLVEIPDLSDMQIKLTLSEANYKRIDKNQKINITVDAIPGLLMTGKVKLKEPMGRPVKENSKIKEFGVVVSIDELKGELVPGLSTTCQVILNEVSDTLLVPYISVFEKDSLKVAYVRKQGGRFEQRNVETGLHNNKYAIVTSGLEPDDEVALSKPPGKLIIQTD